MAKKKAMSFIEMVCCMAIIAVCLIALVKGFGSMGLLQSQQRRQDHVVVEVETLLHSLEHQPATITSGKIDKEWSYHTSKQEGHYVLTVVHDTDAVTYSFLIKEALP